MSSDTLITEIPAGDAKAQAAAFLKLARVPGLPPIRDRVPADRLADLDAAIVASGVPEHALDRMASWAAAMALSTGQARNDGATREAAPEAVLARAFAGRRHAALETVAGQLGIFAALPERAQRLLLVEAVRGGTAPAADYRALLTAWASGDGAAMDRTFNEAFAAAPELRTALITDRNQAWAMQLARRARAPGTLLVAVGAGHLVGTDGLPALLSARGFRVARIQ